MGEINVPCLKWLLYIFHLVTFLVGSALVAIGSLYITLFKHEFHFAEFSINLASLVFIGTGAFLILLAVFGVFATRSTNRYFVLAHIAGLFIAFGALAILGVWGLFITHNGSLTNEVEKTLMESIENFNETESEKINWLQKEFSCCGVAGMNDWKNKSVVDQVESELPEDSLMANNRTTFPVPDSCCVNVTDSCGKNYPALESLNQDGCMDKLNSFILNDMKIICGLACILAGLTLVAIIFMIYVYLRVRGDYSQLNTNA